MAESSPTSAAPGGHGEFLLELRAEEIPARMLPGAARELATRVFEELMGRGLGPREVETGFTPRRILLVLKGVPARQADQEETLWGPPVGAAYDKQGNPTQALLGFAKRAEVEPGAVQRAKKDKGEYLMAVRTKVGRPASEVLAEVVPRVVAALSWPKTMRWGDGIGPWVRPLHGILALYDGEVVPIEIFGVRSGNVTVGHPLLSPEAFSVSDAADYRARLAERGIVVSPEERKRSLAERMAARAAELGGKLVEDEELLAKLAAICEIPGVMEGAVAAPAMVLPREVLTTSLRDHQSAFTVEREGQLLAVFLTVMDRPDDPAGRVRAGNEWVVAARLADARFFYGEDKKLALSERATRLEHLTFHERLGSYAAKSERLVALAERICEALGWQDEMSAVHEAARLLKVDLGTEMVKEFTSLQGVMGGIYAREEGYPEAVWQAIYDQYLPAATGDRIPRGRAGLAVGLADRLDTLAGMFGLGLVPTGSKDPFGLRRAAQGAVRIVLEGGLALDLEPLVQEAVALYGERLRRSGDQVLADLQPFFYDRMRYVLGLDGFAYDEIEAALAVGGLALVDLRARAAALHTVREEPHFLSIVLAAKRIANILKDAPPYPLVAERLAEPAEKALHAGLEKLRRDVEEAAVAREYERCLRRVEELAEVLDRFFVEVLVMAEDEAVRRNRLALLQEIHRVLSSAAKLTEMVVEKKKGE